MSHSILRVARVKGSLSPQMVRWKMSFAKDGVLYPLISPRT
ncbi:hypothetical protein GP2222_20860 [Bacillus subtilis subsp. subtilis str. 168]|nr:hypothetical protein GP2222_20860 [Bacillus subtilis subsp. subtilis str. 168]AQR86157.1 hypothetical protein GP2223_20870 [Bacillus subtilis subsp. subtilis str. 168]